jgi:5-methylcytosine-specific restriction protein B
VPKDNTKYLFNGETYGKSRLVLAVVKAYLHQSKPTLKELRDAFPKKLQGSFGVFYTEQEYNTRKQKSKDQTERFFTKSEERLSADGEQIFICTEWGTGNISDFIEHAKNLGFDISENSTNSNEVCWFLGASFGGNDDQTERFVSDGIWQSGDDGKYTDKIQQIQKGDKIAIKSVYTRTHGLPFDNQGEMASVMDIKAVGVVTENLNDGKTVKVDWESNFKKLTWYMYTYQPRIWKVTPDKIEAKALIDFTFNGAAQNFNLFLSKNNLPDSVATSLNENSELVLSSLNQIFYGPPGTGKTYHSIEAAVKAADPELYTELGIDEKYGATAAQRTELTGMYKELFDAGRIKFVTFHQSYGYEEFVEGLSAKTEGNSLSYFEKDGVFKVICDDAKKNLKDSQKSVKELSDEKRFDKALEDFKLSMFDEADEYPLTEACSLIVIEKDGFRYGGKWNNTSIMKYDDLKALFLAGVDSRQGIKKAENVSGLAKQHASYFIRALEAIKGFIPQASTNTVVSKKQNFVLIIDEINRGNISKIFGELITLIDPSKRLGQPEALEAILPYSGDKFSVPDNLYIIGTMNTADRSLALMDTALRRRFDFVEMMPEYGVLHDEEGQAYRIEKDGFAVDLASLLKTLNSRISALYDREHMLGHAFLMPVVSKIKSGEQSAALSELANCFKNKIIPLLAEYFFEDWQKIRLVLGDNQKEKMDIPSVIEKVTVEFEKLFGDTEELDLLDDEALEYRLITANSDLWDDPLTYIGMYDVTELDD